MVGHDQGLVADRDHGLAAGAAVGARASDRPEVGLQVSLFGPDRCPRGLGEGIRGPDFAVAGAALPAVIGEPGAVPRATACIVSKRPTDIRELRNHARTTIGKSFSGGPHARIETGRRERAHTGAAPLIAHGLRSRSSS